MSSLTTLANACHKKACQQKQCTSRITGTNQARNQARTNVHHTVDKRREMDVLLFAMGPHQQYKLVRRIAVVDVPPYASLNEVRGELEVDADEFMLPKDFRFLYRETICPIRKAFSDLREPVSLGTWD